MRLIYSGYNCQGYRYTGAFLCRAAATRHGPGGDGGLTMKTVDHIFHNGVKYEWLGQSTVRVIGRDGFVLYFDPVMLDSDPPKADLLLISHHHVDHCLPEFVVPIRSEDTALGAHHDSYVKHCAQDIKGVRAIKIGQTVELRGVKVTGVSAYTMRGFHEKEDGVETGCGFLVDFFGQRIYFSGDTAATPEMEELSGIDVAIICIADNIGAISTTEMIEAARRLSPQLFIPVHFTPEDAPEPELKEGMLGTKDPRFFTTKVDIEALDKAFEGTGVEVAHLKMLASYGDESF